MNDHLWAFVEVILLMISEDVKLLGQKVSADGDVFDGKWLTGKFSTLHYLGGTSYGGKGVMVCSVEKLPIFSGS